MASGRDPFRAERADPLLKRLQGLMARGRLQALVAERNVRRVIVHVTRPTAHALNQTAESRQALDVLRAHGFRVGFSVRGEPGEPRATLASLPTREQIETPSGSFSALHVVESGLEIDEPSQGNLFTVHLPGTSPEWTNSLQRLAAEILGLEKASLTSAVRLFGAHLVSTRQVFHETPLSYCLVNLKPIVPGHVLVVPKRCVARFELLGADEVSDLWCTAQLVGSVIERQYGASSLTFAIQDGREAGQMVEHVHIHVIPRRRDDFEENDDVYEKIEVHERRLRVDIEQRRGRSLEEMAAEASSLRELLKQ